MILKGYFKDAHVALLVYDVTLNESWEGVRHWHEQMLASKEECPSVKFVVIGTREDRITMHKDVNLDEILK